MTQRSGKRAIVLGLGKSGIAAAKLLLSRGFEVVGTDSAPAERLSKEVFELGIRVIAGGHAQVPFDEVELIVVSPGVPPLPKLTHAESKGVEVIGELELAARYVDAPIIAVGGTNGKSTVTTLTALMLSEAGYRTFSGGNLGTPLSCAVGGEWDCLLVEVSSFQLERIVRFKPKISILLNVTEDHLDRYASFQGYAEAKGNAFVNQEHEDVAVIPWGDAICEEQARRGAGHLLRFGVAGDFCTRDREVLESASGDTYSLVGTRLHGAHNVSNAAACIAAARAFGASPTAIRKALAEFVPLAHRMAFVAEHRGVRYYDDSKGTNVGASVTALLGLSEARGVLIAGGRDKLGSYGPLVDALRTKGRGLVVIGEAADAIASAAADTVPVERATSMAEAVRKAEALAQPGDAVLLSPACASFDMFRSYSERGDCFVTEVRALASEDSQQAGTPC